MKKYIVTGIGADVELFVQNRKTKEIISAEGLVQGTKDNPFVFDAENPHFATSLDNVLAEFGIPPATNKVEFYNYLRKSRTFIEKSLPMDLCTAVLPAAELDPQWLTTRQAKRFGCEPDYNAYTMKHNFAPKANNPNLRSAGGHIHIGYAEAEPFSKGAWYEPDVERALLVRALDLHIGIPSVIMEPDNKRKELYGKAGAFRPKEYGVEYRTLSNYYMQSKKLTYWVYQQVIEAINWLNSGGVIEDFLGSHIEAVINNNNKAEAESLISNFNLKLV
jgi:hypothetical protein